MLFGSQSHLASLKSYQPSQHHSHHRQCCIPPYSWETSTQQKKSRQDSYLFLQDAGQFNHV